MLPSAKGQSSTLLLSQFTYSFYLRSKHLYQLCALILTCLPIALVKRSLVTGCIREHALGCLTSSKNRQILFIPAEIQYHSHARHARTSGKKIKRSRHLVAYLSATSHIWSTDYFNNTWMRALSASFR